MKDREAAAVVAAGICLSVVLLRLLAPEMPFDWMTLALVLAAAASVLFSQGGPERHGRRSAPHPFPGSGMAAPFPQGAGNTSYPPKAFETAELIAQLSRMDWEAGTGGLFDALRALHGEKPFAAMCAARGSLLMLTQKMPAGQASGEALSALCVALDHAAQAGERAVDSDTVDALFEQALRALGWLEAQNS